MKSIIDKLLRYLVYPLICVSISAYISMKVTVVIYPEADIDVMEQIAFFVVWCSFLTLLSYAAIVKLHKLIIDKKDENNSN